MLCQLPLFFGLFSMCVRLYLSALCLCSFRVAASPVTTERSPLSASSGLSTVSYVEISQDRENYVWSFSKKKKKKSRNAVLCTSINCT